MAVTGIGTYASYTNSYGNTQNAGNKTGRTYKNAHEYKNYLTQKYDCLRSRDYSVNINSSLLSDVYKRQALSDITYEYDCIFEKLVEELKPYDFVVNCRGNLVNLRHIEKIKGFNIYLDNGKELQIAQKRSSDFREEVNKFLQRNSQEKR